MSKKPPRIVRNVGPCAECGRTMFNDMELRGGEGKRRHRDCEHAQYILDHWLLTTAEASRQFYAEKRALQTQAPRQREGRIKGIPAASDVRITDAEGRTRLERSSERRAERIIRGGLRKPRTWDETHSSRGGGHEAT